jgi:hypothetical protein
LFSTLVHYYEEILSMSGTCRRPKPKHFKRLMRDAMETAGVMAAGGGEASTTDPPPVAAAEAVTSALAAAPAAAAVASESAQVMETAADAPSNPQAAMTAGPQCH